MSDGPSPRYEDAYGVLVVREQAGGARFSTPSHSATNARWSSSIRLLRELRAHPAAESGGGDALILHQFDDHAHFPVRSTAFGRRAGASPFVELIVDPYFHFSGGFAELRAWSLAGEAPPWSEREPVLFWRGSSTNNGWTAAGERVRSLAEIPRVAMALRLRGHPHADVRLFGGWIQPESEAEVRAWFQAEGIDGDRRSMPEHARHRFQLDIDGVANAWATLERFLCGSCVFKVESPFEMWFYDRLRPWVHYVPVAADGSDIEARLDWALAEPEAARAIAEAGRALALELTHAHALELSARRLAACRIPQDGG